MINLIKNKKMKKRTLGKSGLEVSALGLVRQKLRLSQTSLKKLKS